MLPPSLLSTITNQPKAEGLRMVVAGVEKIGKTTFCALAPTPLLIPTEIGYSGVTVDKTGMVESYPQLLTLMNEVTHYAKQGTFPYRTLIFDSATALERLIHSDILSLDKNKNATMISTQGGYGKGYDLANERFSHFLKLCDVLAVHGAINIIFTSHIFTAKLVDPIVGEFDSWNLRLHSPNNQRTFGKREMISEWADIIGFLHEPLFISKTEGESITRAISKNQGRMMGVSRTPSYAAGNRFGMVDEIPISKDNGWNDFATALYHSSGINILT